MEAQTYKIPEVTPSYNQILHWHWTKRREVKDLWFHLVYKYVGTAKVKATTPRHFHIIRAGRRFIDDPNVPAGTKYLIDALIHFGHAVDDARPWCRVTYDQHTVGAKDDPYMAITISQWEEPK